MPNSAPDGAGGRSKYAESFTLPGDAQHDVIGPSIAMSSKNAAFPVIDEFLESTKESAKRKTKSPMGNSALMP